MIPLSAAAKTDAMTYHHPLNGQRLWEITRLTKPPKDTSPNVLAKNLAPQKQVAGNKHF
jgi:hypothetical protein